MSAFDFRPLPCRIFGRKSAEKIEAEKAADLLHSQPID